MANATLPPLWADPDPDPDPSSTAPSPRPRGGLDEPFVYQPALDGLRAVAVGAVLLYHGGVSWMPGGFLGVDLFFTLSGFLITSLLLREVRGAGGVAYGRFWSRRLRRLFPALLVMIVFIAAYIAWWAPESQRASIRGDAYATLAYVVNWRFVFTEASYFDQFLAPSPLRHAWSLAIEEQYYVVWPLILAGLVFVVGKRLLPLAAVIGGLAVASTVWMWVLFDPAGDPSRVYYGTDTRAQSILVGAVLAVLLVRFPLHPGRAWRLAIVVVGGIALAALAFAWTQVGELDAALYRGGFFLHAIGAVAVILAAIMPGSNPVKWVLSIDVLRWIGKVSYGLYLYHWPIFLVINGERTGLDGFALLAVRLLITGGVAVLSFVIIEEPIRRGERISTATAWVAMPMAVFTVVALLVATTWMPAGASRSVASEPAPTTVARPDATTTTPAPAPVITTPVRVAVLGDSFAYDIGLGLMRLGEAGEPVVTTDGGRPGCGVARGGVIKADQREIDLSTTCGDWEDEWNAALGSTPEFALIVSGAWEMTDRDVGAGFIEYGTPRHDKYLTSEYRKAIRFVRARGVEPVLTTFPYVQLREYADGSQPPNNDPARVRHMNDLIRSVAESQSVPVIELNQYLAPTDVYTDDVAGITVRDEDRAHFSPAGEEYIGRWLIQQLAQLR